MEVPNEEDRKRCFEIRCNSKRGNRIHPDDHNFCMEMHEKYPEWYSKTEKEVFEITAPFGSSL